MLSFQFVLTNPDNIIIKEYLEEYKDTYPDKIELCGLFRIYIDGELFFDDPQFPILEFLFCVKKWIKRKYKSNMLYCSVETDENPLISFVPINNKWKICSKWQLFDSGALFPLDKIEFEINKLTIELQKYFKSYYSGK